MKLISFLCVSFLACGLVTSEPDEEPPPGAANSNNGGPKPEDYLTVTIIEGPNTTSSVGKRGSIPGKDQRCRWSWNKLHNEGSILRCSCLRCVCTKTHWMCDYNFKYCPFFYCGNKVFNPLSQVCCCGKIYAKKTNWLCCGYNYYNTKLQKCCSYSTIKNKGETCPRFQV